MTEFEYEGKFYLTEGLIQIWQNPLLSAHEDNWKDPPVFLEEVTEWMETMGVVYHPTPVVGPPMWVFSTRELRDEFVTRFGLKRKDEC